MGDILSPTGSFIPWHALPQLPMIATRKERAYYALLTNLQPSPIIEASLGQQLIFFANTMDK